MCSYTNKRNDNIIRHVALKHGECSGSSNHSVVSQQVNMNHSHKNSGNPPQYSCVTPQQSVISTRPLSVPQPMGHDGGVNPSLHQTGYAYNNCNGNCALQNKEVHFYPEYATTLPPNQ